MNRRTALGAIGSMALMPAIGSQIAVADDIETIRLRRIGRYATGEALGGAEIVSFHAPRNRLFVVNSGAGQIEVLNLSDPTSPSQAAVLDAANMIEQQDPEALGSESAAGTNSVSVQHDVLATAIEADPATADGAVAFYDPVSLEFMNAVSVGPLPDKVTIAPDGNRVVVANEGEPGESNPAGSISIIDISNGARKDRVQTVGFESINGQKSRLRREGVHLVSQSDGASKAATTIEPEYVTITPDSSTAFVSLQENNAIATVDLQSGTLQRIDGLGFKDFSLPHNELDASDVDGASLQQWPLKGMYQPDAIDTYTVAGETFVVTANEGDAKDFEVALLKNLSLDPDGFELSENPYVDSIEELQEPKHLGNMEVNKAAMAEFADPDGDGKYRDIYAIGGRSFSVWKPTANGLRLVFDSGSEIERTFAEQRPAGHLNVTESGPETESIELGHIGERTYAFVGQEVGSGIAVYDVTAPGGPEYIQMAINREYSVTEEDIESQAEENPSSDTPSKAGDFAPEGITFVSQTDSPIPNPLLCVGFEISGTVAIFEVQTVKK